MATSSVAVSMCLLIFLAIASPAYSFWLTSRAKAAPPQWFGIRDYGVASQSAYSYDSTGGVAVAVPVAVPLSPQQVSPPYPGLTSVQLVPCLCPISKDPEMVKPLPTPATQTNVGVMQTAQPSQQ